MKSSLLSRKNSRASRNGPVGRGFADSDPRLTRGDLEGRLQSMREELAAAVAELELETMRQTQRELEESRERYIDLYDFAPVGYLSLDRAGIIRSINLTGAHLLGYDRKFLIDRALLPLVASSDRRKFLHHLQRLRDGAEHVTTELQLFAKDKPPVPVQIISLRPGRGRLSQNFRSVIWDLTERKRSEAAIRAKETQFQLITNIAPVMLARCGRNLGYQFVNAAYAKFIGLPATQIVGQSLPEVLGKEAFAAISPHVDTV